MTSDELIKKLITQLENGLTLDWTDARIYLVVILSSFIGGLIGTYFAKFFGKRGEIDAIKGDLDEITKIQEEIKSRLSTDAFIDQKWWDLKRETYWDITKSLSSLSDALWNVNTYCFDSDEKPISNIDVYKSYVEKLLQAIDVHLKYTGISHIVMCKDGTDVILNLSRVVKNDASEMNDEKLVYKKLVSMRKSVNAAYDRIVDIAKKDLRSVLD